MGGGGVPRGDPPPNKCWEFLIYFCRLTRPLSHILKSPDTVQHASYFCPCFIDALTHERKWWRGCPALWNRSGFKKRQYFDYIYSTNELFIHEFIPERPAAKSKASPTIFAKLFLSLKPFCTPGVQIHYKDVKVYTTVHSCLRWNFLFPIRMEACKQTGPINLGSSWKLQSQMSLYMPGSYLNELFLRLPA